jgi:tetratricopeptide (TPR) repeat protein
MVHENRLQQLAQKQIWLENELSQRPRSVQLGDIFIFIYSGDELGLQWVILDKKDSEFFIVPADDTPMVGSMDIDLPDSALCSPLTLRCDFGVWVDAKYFDLELRIGVLEEWHRRRALERVKQISEKTLKIQFKTYLIQFLKFWHRGLPKMLYRLVGDIASVGSVLYQEMNYEPAYLDFKQQLNKERRALRRTLSALKKSTKPISKNRVGWTWKVSLATAVGLVLAVGLFVLFQQVYEKQQLELAETDNNQVVQYYQQGQFQQAQALAEKAFKIRKNILGEKHPDTLVSLNNLAGIYSELGRFSEALPLTEKAYSLSKEMLGEKHPDTLVHLNNLAGIYQKLGRFSEALALSEKAYSLSKEVGEKNPYTTVASLNNLGMVYQTLGRLDDALHLSEQAYLFSQEVLGEKHPDTLISLNNLAEIYSELGRFSDALALSEKAYSLSKEMLGEQHPDTFTSLNNLAMAYQTLGRLDEALPLYKKVYYSSTEILGEKHPDTLVSLNNLAYIYSELGHFSEALALSEKAYFISKKGLGEKHPDTLISLNNLAYIYSELGRFSQALALSEKAYSLSKEVLGEQHPDTFTSLNNLAMAYQTLGRLDEALPLYKKVYYSSTEILGEKHPDTLTSLNNLADIYQKLGSLDKALPLYEKSFRLSANKTYELAEELDDFQFRWEKPPANIMAFSPQSHLPSSATKAFGAGLFTARESLLGKHPIRLSPPLLPPPSVQSWVTTEWNSHFQLGRWLFLLWTACQFPEQMPKTFWAQQSAILAQFIADFDAQTTDDAQDVLDKLDRQQIEQLLNQLPAFGTPESDDRYDDLGERLKKVISFLAPAAMEKQQ